MIFLSEKFSPQKRELYFNNMWKFSLRAIVLELSSEKELFYLRCEIPSVSMLFDQYKINHTTV